MPGKKLRKLYVSGMPPSVFYGRNRWKAMAALLSLQRLNGGYGWLEVKCHRCESQVSIPLAEVRRPRGTEIWKLEAAFRCRSCSTKRYKPLVHLIKLTKQREVALAPWYHPSEEDRL